MLMTYLGSPMSPAPLEADIAGNSTPTLPNYLQDPILKQTYDVGRLLGKGGFAWCYEVKSVEDNSRYALKVIPKTNAIRDHHRNKVLREISIHYPLQHDQVVRLYSAFEDDENIYMVLELCPMESLMHIMKKRKLLTEAETRYFLRQLLSGLQYLHENARVLHRDLKLGNMLLSDDMKVKIADFGLAAEIDQNSLENIGHVCGTPNYIAPEVLRKEGHTYASDMWAVGCILYAMLIGKPPFETHSLKLTYELILNSRFSFPSSCRYVSRHARDLICSLLNPVSANRPDASQALNHEFLKESIANCLVGQDDRRKVDMDLCKDKRLNKDLTSLTSSNHHKHSSTTGSDLIQSKGPHSKNSKMDQCTRPQCGSSMHFQLPYTPKLQVTRSVSSEIENKENHPLSSTHGKRNTSGSPDSGFNSCICAIDALGNASFGPCQEANLSQAMKCYYYALLEANKLNNNVEALISARGDQIYVTKWIDYSNRYGFGCEYNNGGVSIMQNDGTRLCLSRDRRYCRRWSECKTGSSISWTSEVFDLVDDEMVLGSSAGLLKHFVKYMDSNLRTGGISDKRTSYSSIAVPFVVMWRRFSDCIVIVLSDGTFQVNFLEQHTKVVLSRSTNATYSPTLLLTIIDDSLTVRTFPLNSNITRVIDDRVYNRLMYLLSSDVMAQSPDGVATAV